MVHLAAAWTVIYIILFECIFIGSSAHNQCRQVLLYFRFQILNSNFDLENFVQPFEFILCLKSASVILVGQDGQLPILSFSKKFHE